MHNSPGIFLFTLFGKLLFQCPILLQAITCNLFIMSKSFINMLHILLAQRKMQGSGLAKS